MTGGDRTRRRTAEAQGTRLAVRRVLGPDGIESDVAFDLAESPLGWLVSRKDRDGSPLIGADEFVAGERLRQDATIAGLIGRTTMNWDAVGGRAERRSAGPGAGMPATDAAIDARARVNRAITALGPELGSVALDVCCHFQGLTDIEAARGWPQRSGKVVLRLALAALARHYGLSPAAHGRERSRVRSWAAADAVRPSGAPTRPPS